MAKLNRRALSALFGVEYNLMSTALRDAGHIQPYKNNLFEVEEARAALEKHYARQRDRALREAENYRKIIEQHNRTAADYEAHAHRCCETCRNHLGGGYNNCRVNLESECAAGNFEAWEQREAAE